MAVVVQLALAVVIAISGWVAVLSVRGLLIVQRIQYGDYDAAEIMDVIVHTFSHFRLHLQPLRLRKVAPRPGVGDNADLRWVGRAELACLGLPAPIRRLLHSL